MKKRKILIYTENYVPGGGNRFLVDIINGLCISNQIILCSNINGLFPIDLKGLASDIPIKTIKISSVILLRQKLFNKLGPLYSPLLRFVIDVFFKLFSLIFLFIYSKKNKSKLRELVNEIRPELIFCCNGGYPGGISCFDLIQLSAKKKIPCFLSVVSIPQKKKWFENILYNNLPKLVSGVVVNTEMIKKHLQQRGFNPQLIQVINNTVDSNPVFDAQKFLDFTKTTKKRAEVWIGYIGRIEQLKGVFELIKAFGKVNGKFPETKLVLVGTGDDLESINQIIVKLGIKENVILTGFFDGSIYDALANFDLFVFPSWWEGLPYSVLEAMSAGKIIICTNVGGIPEVIINGKNGFLVKPKDEAGLTSKINEVVGNIAFYSFLGQNAKQTIEEGFSRSHFNSMISSFVESFNTFSSKA